MSFQFSCSFRQLLFSWRPLFCSPTGCLLAPIKLLLSSDLHRHHLLFPFASFFVFRPFSALQKTRGVKSGLGNERQDSGSSGVVCSLSLQLKPFSFGGQHLTHTHIIYISLFVSFKSSIFSTFQYSMLRQIKVMLMWQELFSTNFQTLELKHESNWKPISSLRQEYAKIS